MTATKCNINTSSLALVHGESTTGEVACGMSLLILNVDKVDVSFHSVVAVVFIHPTREEQVEVVVWFQVRKVVAEALRYHCWKHIPCVANISLLYLACLVFGGPDFGHHVDDAEAARQCDVVKALRLGRLRT